MTVSEFDHELRPAVRAAFESEHEASRPSPGLRRRVTSHPFQAGEPTGSAFRPLVAVAIVLVLIVPHKGQRM